MQCIGASAHALQFLSLQHLTILHSVELCASFLIVVATALVLRRKPSLADRRDLITLLIHI